LKHQQKIIPRLLPPLIFFFLLIIIWETAVQLLKVPIYLVPSPSNIAHTIILNFFSLIRDTGITLLEALFGFFIGGLFGFFIAVILRNLA